MKLTFFKADTLLAAFLAKFIEPVNLDANIDIAILLSLNCTKGQMILQLFKQNKRY